MRVDVTEPTDDTALLGLVVGPPGAAPSYIVNITSREQDR